MNDLIEKNQEENDSLRNTLSEFYSLLFDYKKIVFLIPFLLSLITAAYTLSITSIYESQTTLAANSQSSSGLSGILNNSGLAAIAGITSSTGTRNLGAEGIEILKSRKFITDFIKEEKILVNLMAAEGWDKDKNEVIINPDVYDIKNKKWTLGDNSMPSDQEAYKAFVDRMSLSTDVKTGFVTLKIKHFSPEVAKEWTEKLVKSLNDYLREVDLIEAEKTISYLDKLLSENNLREGNSSLVNLKQQQIKIIMNAKAREQYVFRVLDPPVAPEKRFSPKRTQIVVSSGFIYFSIFFLLAYLLKKLGYRENFSLKRPWIFK